MQVLTEVGTVVLRRDSQGRVFYSGTGGSDDGDRPFLVSRPTLALTSAPTLQLTLAL